MSSRSVVPFTSKKQSMPKSPQLIESSGLRSLSSGPARLPDNDRTPDHQFYSESSEQELHFFINEEIVKIIPYKQNLRQILKHLKKGTICNQKGTMITGMWQCLTFRITGSTDSKNRYHSDGRLPG